MGACSFHNSRCPKEIAAICNNKTALRNKRLSMHAGAMTFLFPGTCKIGVFENLI